MKISRINNLKLNRIWSISILSVLVLCISQKDLYAQKYLEISKDDFRKKIEGFWYGQLTGNYLGFPFELVYIDQPLPRMIQRYYNQGDLDSIDIEMQLNDRRAYTNIMADALGGAWSDDDTDIEFVTLHAVEKYGLDITYPEMTEMWKKHINRFIWVGNARARELMDQGHIPPATGSKLNNEYWNAIDAQLVNEIWSVFYPAMTDKASERALWGARITNDDWGTHATIAYAVMYSAAFYEENTDILVEMAIQNLPENSPFRMGMEDVVEWKAENSSWRDTRNLIHNKYFDFQTGSTWPPVTSLVNGLCGIMAILYGEGDFIKTTSIAVSAGYDCDNQAATCGGLIGVLKGVDAIPMELLTGLPSRNQWNLPFNDQYINYSRDGLPNVTPITEIVDRIIAISETAIIGSGGEITIEAGNTVYRIPFSGNTYQTESIQ